MKAHHLFAACALASSACVYEQPVLMPAKDAAVYPGRRDVGLAETAGIRLMVQGDAWRGNPRHLADLVTPLHVTIENQSGRTLRIRYSDFALAGDSGMTYGAIQLMPSQNSQVGALAPDGAAPVLAAEGQSARIVLAQSAQATPGARTRSIRVVRPRFYHRGFYVAPHFGWAYPGLQIWAYPFPYDSYYYDRYYQSWQEPFPTQDMLDEALPEGALETGGEVRGFVYFQHLGRRETRVDLRATLVDTANGENVAEARIPLVVWR